MPFVIMGGNICPTFITFFNNCPAFITIFNICPVFITIFNMSINFSEVSQLLFWRAKKITELTWTEQIFVLFSSKEKKMLFQVIECPQLFHLVYTTQYLYSATPSDAGVHYTAPLYTSLLHDTRAPDGASERVLWQQQLCLFINKAFVAAISQRQ